MSENDFVAELVLASERRAAIEAGEWPPAVSNGLEMSCADCGDDHIRFDYRVTDEFWRQHVPGAERAGVVCLPCLDQRCEGVGLAEALIEVQWTGTGHTVVLSPGLRYVYP